MRTFKRSPRGDEWLGGVCSGAAYALELPTWIARLAVFLLVWAGGTGVLFYILVCLFAPEWATNEPADYYEVTGS